jgi:drug/metabolite transporter (DMT)-like permease
MIGSRHKVGIALGIVGVVLFGGTLPATRLAVASIDPLFLTAARAAIAGCAGLAFVLIRRRPLPPTELWTSLLVAGLCTVVGFPLLMAVAMVSVPAAHGGVVLGIVPLATTMTATLVAHERPSLGFWLVSLAGGALVVVFVLSQSEARSVVLGDFFLFLTVIAGAFGYALNGRLSLRMPGWEVISWQVVTLLPPALIAVALLWPSNLSAAPASAWAGLAYVSFVSQFFAFFVFNAAMAAAGVARVGQLMLLQPFVVVGLAAVVNGEPPRLVTLAYAAAVVATVAVGQRMRVVRGAGKDGR